MIAALAEFGAPTSHIAPEDFVEPEVFFQIGVEPVRVDIMTSVAGLDFEGAWKSKSDGRLRRDVGAGPLPPGRPEGEIGGRQTARP